MLKIAILAVLFTAFCIAETNTIQAQNQALSLERPSPSKVAQIAGKQNVKVNAELQRQQKFLQDIAARYEEVSAFDLTPLLKFPYVWNALRENRARVALLKSELTAAQLRQFKKAYDLLEEETLFSFLDQQLNLLTDTLELDEAQQEQVLKILTMDLSNKRSLLLMSVGPEEFRRRLDGLSDAAEKRILAFLYPEQRKMFDRQQMLNRNRMIG
jgi:hypothetical protein